MINFPADSPPEIIYKYLRPCGARNFLAAPQLRFTKLAALDDILDTMPGFSPQTDAEAYENALERVRRAPIESVSIEHQIAFHRRTGKLSPVYLEKLFREIREEQAGSFFVCSMSAELGSLAMWSLYAERHAGIVFGISPRLDRAIQAKGRIVYRMLYSPDRPHTAFNNPKGEEVAPTLWTKGMDWAHQEEWRILSSSDEIEYLKEGEVKEVIFGHRYDAGFAGEKMEHMKKKVFQGTRFFDAIPSATKFKMDVQALDLGA